MVNSKFSPIAIKLETKQKLEAIKGKNPKESWDDLINRLIPKTDVSEAIVQ